MFLGTAQQVLARCNFSTLRTKRVWMRTDHPGRCAPGQRPPRAPPGAANAAEQRATRRLGSRCLLGMAATESVLNRAGASAGPGADSVMTPARTPGRPPGPFQRFLGHAPEDPKRPPSIPRCRPRAHQGAPERVLLTDPPETRQGPPGVASRLPSLPRYSSWSTHGALSDSTGCHRKVLQVFRQFLNMFH